MADVVDTGIQVGDNADDIITLLSEDTADVKDDKPKTEPKVKDVKDDADDKNSEDPNADDLELKDDKEDKPEEIDEDKEKLDLKDDINIDAPPRLKEIEKEFPGFGKKFPFLVKMMFRDKEITETFGSFDNLKEAAGKAEALDELESSFASGDATALFSKMKENDPQAFGKVVKNLLPHLQAVDKDAYYTITTDLMARTLDHIFKDGQNSKNEELQEAAKAIFGYIFPRGYKADEASAEPVKDEKLEQERAQFRQERLETAFGEVRTKIANTLRNTVDSYIDQKGEMSDYVKRNATREVLESVDKQMSGDQLFRKSINTLWEQAEKAKFSKPSLDKIKSAYLGKAKGLLRKAIVDARKEALKGSAPNRAKQDQDETPPKRGIISTGRSTPRTSGKPQMKPGESIEEFLARD